MAGWDLHPLEKSAALPRRTPNPDIAGAVRLAKQMCLMKVLDRIRFDRTHTVGSIDPVNPVTIYKVEQIHGR